MDLQKILLTNLIPIIDNTAHKETQNFVFGIKL